MANEKRLIDAKPLMKSGWHLVKTGESNVFLASMSLADVPTVDAVEVAEYDAMVNKLECLLCHATGGKYSKAGYSWEDMERMVTDYIEECCEEAVAEALAERREGKMMDKEQIVMPDFEGMYNRTADELAKVKTENELLRKELDQTRKYNAWYNGVMQTIEVIFGKEFNIV